VTDAGHYRLKAAESERRAEESDAPLIVERCRVVAAQWLNFAALANVRSNKDKVRDA